MCNKLEVLAEAARGRATFHPVQNAAVLKVPGEVIHIVTAEACVLVDADLIEAGYAPLEADRIPLVVTEQGRQFLRQLAGVGVAGAPEQSGAAQARSGLQRGSGRDPRWVVNADGVPAALAGRYPTRTDPDPFVANPWDRNLPGWRHRWR